MVTIETGGELSYWSGICAPSGPMAELQHPFCRFFQSPRSRLVSMDSPLLIGWQQEKAELQQEVSGLQEELVETRAEKEELQSRSRALQERVRLGVKGHMIVTQHSAFVISTAPPLSLSSSSSSQSLPRSPSLCSRRQSSTSGGGG